MRLQPLAGAAKAVLEEGPAEAGAVKAVPVIIKLPRGIRALVETAINVSSKGAGSLILAMDQLFLQHLQNL